VLKPLVLLLCLGVDGGVDAGAVPVEPTPPAPAHWTWTHADGGWLDDAGTSDRLTVRVGETAQVKFTAPIILMQCDEPLLDLGATLDTLLLTGKRAGSTKCGFWYRKNSYPDRLMQVTVSP